MVGPRVSTHFAGSGRENENMRNAGIGKKSPVLRNASTKLKFSGYILIGVGTSNPLLDFPNSTLTWSYSLYKFQIDSPGPHGQPESCSYHEGFHTLNFSLIEVRSGFTTPKTSKRNRLRRGTEKKNRSRLQLQEKKTRQLQAFSFLFFFTLILRWFWANQANALFSIIFSHSGWFRAKAECLALVFPKAISNAF